MWHSYYTGQVHDKLHRQNLRKNYVLGINSSICFKNVFPLPLFCEPNY
jgi:hypothetical protein